ncbi:unnamed protein product [Strongylus vulgaris]|uniref:CRC domain-containing protein n=1 Tax=Strongylus vulgaris TaxID=40348 RepID=A0A3P7IF97_STRVU|nr:unnamed protein product [Strongylus vulgaris]
MCHLAKVANAASLSRKTVRLRMSYQRSHTHTDKCLPWIWLGVVYDEGMICSKNDFDTASADALCLDIRTEDGEPIYLEDDEYAEVFREEEYVQLEDGTFVQAEQHAVAPQTSASAISQRLQRVRMETNAQRASQNSGSQFPLPHRQQNFDARINAYAGISKAAAAPDHFSLGVSLFSKFISYSYTDAPIRRQPPLELSEKTNVIGFSQTTSNASKPYSSSSSSSTIFHPFAHTYNVPKQKKKPLPGQRKPCNCTKSMCLKLYCDCFANGEFCMDCNCKDCHNNLEHDADRSKAIKQSLERNPNAFKPKIGVIFGVKSGKLDAERLHQKGCHCKKSGCLKNYCECFEAKVPCTSRCKCQGCQNTEGDRASRLDRLFSCIIKKEFFKKWNGTKKSFRISCIPDSKEHLSSFAPLQYLYRIQQTRQIRIFFRATFRSHKSVSKCYFCDFFPLKQSEGEMMNTTSSALMSLAHSSSSVTTESPSPLSDNDSDTESSIVRNDPRSYPWFYMTDEVIEAATLCLVAQAEESLSGCSADVPNNVVEEMERMVLGEFGRCLQEIISNASES